MIVADFRNNKGRICFRQKSYANVCISGVLTIYHSPRKKTIKMAQKGTKSTKRKTSGNNSAPTRRTDSDKCDTWVISLTTQRNCRLILEKFDLYGWYALKGTKAARPERAEALKLQTINKAFALTGRLTNCHYTQGAALG